MIGAQLMKSYCSIALQRIHDTLLALERKLDWAEEAQQLNFDFDFEKCSH